MQVVEHSPADATLAASYFRLAAHAQAEGRIADAIEWLHRAIAYDAENATFHYTLGRIHKAQNALPLAEAAYCEALRIDPHFHNAWVSLGILLRHGLRLEEAEAALRRAIELAPRNALGHLNLGNVLYTQQRIAAAAEAFRAALDCNPYSAEAHNNLGKSLLDTEPSAAAEHFDTALRLQPRYFEAARGLGRALQSLSRFEESIAFLTKALELSPGHGETREWLAFSYLASGNNAAARAIYEEEIALRPQSADLKRGLANVLIANGQYNKPKALLEAALALEPANGMARLSYAVFLLRAGEYAKAWEYYESRQSGAHYPKQRPVARPRWQGESLAGRTLLICPEQGLGDEIMFASMYRETLREARHGIIECTATLETLMRRSFPEATVVAVDRRSKQWEDLAPSVPAGQFDCWTACGSLARYRRTEAAHFPHHNGYLRADPKKLESWRARLAQLGPGLKVGISWHGGTATTGVAQRSLALEQLMPLLSLPGVHAINLQYGKRLEEIMRPFTATTGILIHDWPEAHATYDDTAALVCALDVVVSVCTSIIHLTGALGRPAWVLAPHVAEWRYGNSGPSMIWYPSVRIFRQPKPGAWAAVISEVRRDVQELIALQS